MIEKTNKTSQIRAHGGSRPGAGRPLKSGTPRAKVSFRLPLDVLTRLHNYADCNGLELTHIVEECLRNQLDSQQKHPQKCDG